MIDAYFTIDCTNFMEQHPIPQNVTGFQFKLIGDITLKQFGYVAGGLIMAYLSTKISLIPLLLRYPMSAVCALLGIGLAFVPIEERPLDRWLISFFKSMYAPTQYVWKKNNPPPEILLQPLPPPVAQPPIRTQVAPKKAVTPVHLNQPVPVMQTVPIVPPTRPMPPAVTKPPSTSAPPPPKRDWWTQGAPPVKTKAPPAPPQQPVTGKKVVFEEKKSVSQPSTIKPQEVVRLKSEFDKKSRTLSDQIASLQKELTQGTLAKERLLELTQLLTQLLTEKDRLSQELAQVKKQLSERNASITEKPTQYATYQDQSQTTVKIVSPQVAVRAGIPTLTQTPNVITGIIKDSSGTLLPNLIITVKDKDGIPVRALKTNRLGQFAASTPLTSGVYVIEVEDPKKTLQFHRIEVTLTGLVLPPLEISAVSPKDLMRQKLAQEIFGRNAI